MSYLKYLEEKEKSRKRSKNIIVKVLYVLVPVFLITSTFTNERIINKCENINEERVQLLSDIEILNGKIIELQGEKIDTEESLTTEIINRDETLGELNTRLETIRGDNEALLSSEQGALATVENLENENASQRAIIDELLALNDELKNETEIINTQLTNMTIRYDRSKAAHNLCLDVQKELEEQLSGCTNQLAELQKSNTALTQENANNQRKINGLNERLEVLQNQSNDVTIVKVKTLPDNGQKITQVCIGGSYIVKLNGENVANIVGGDCEG